MKKRIVTIALVVALVAIAAVGTLAYFTDTDNATNTFTVGNVSIDLIEEERDGKGGKQNFTQDKRLYPIVGSAQGEKDDLGMPTAKNYVDKMVTIQNTGSEKAYIRAYFAIPSALDDGYETFNAGMNVLHFNFGNTVKNGVVTSTEGQEWQWTHGGKWNYFETTIDGMTTSTATSMTAIAAIRMDFFFISSVLLFFFMYSSLHKVFKGSAQGKLRGSYLPKHSLNAAAASAKPAA